LWGERARFHPSEPQPEILVRVRPPTKKVKNAGNVEGRSGVRGTMSAPASFVWLYRAGATSRKRGWRMFLRSDFWRAANSMRHFDASSMLSRASQSRSQVGLFSLPFHVSLINCILTSRESVR
jgi:hypothetical protein